MSSFRFSITIHEDEGVGHPTFRTTVVYRDKVYEIREFYSPEIFETTIDLLFERSKRRLIEAMKRDRDEAA